MRERSGKAVARNAVKEVRDNVGKKGPGEKAGDIVVPVHLSPPRYIPSDVGLVRQSI
jgi:hypothetical protein